MTAETNKDSVKPIKGSEALTETELLNLQIAIAKDLPKFDGDYAVQRIPGNLSPSARVFKLIAGDDVYVVRILDREHYLEDTTKEIQLITDLSRDRVTPPIYHADATTGIVIMKFIKDMPVFRGGLEETQEALIDLAKKIKKLHTLPLQAKPASLLPSNLQKGC